VPAKLSQSEARKFLGQPAKSKYHAKAVDTVEGYFPSQKEYRRWCELKAMRDAGDIEGLEHGVSMPINVNGQHVCTYVADFTYVRDGRLVVEDTKGVRTAVYKLKAKLVLATRGVKIVEL
jgi:hypothetical protein